MDTDTFSEYDDFAWLYNRYWGNNFTEPALAMLRKSGALRHKDGKGTVLDLCCGTGQLSYALSQMGYHVIGIDGSEQVLQFARKNAPNCKFIQSDARSFSLEEQANIAVSAYDSLNHIMNLQELQQAFKSVHASLKDGGVFVFDLNMKEGFETRWRGSFGLVGDDHTAVLRSNYNPKNKTARLDITMFFRRKELWKRSDLTLMEKCYTEGQIKSSLQKSGFNQIKSFDFQRDLKLREVGRTFFIGHR